MSVVSVVVTCSGDEATLPALLRSLDAQTMPMTDFEVVVAAASPAGGAARLQHLADRRPNVTVLTVGPGASEADLLAAALHAATGDHVLRVPAALQLAPRALALLAEAARTSGAGVALGSVGSSASGVIATTRRDRLDTADPVSALRDAESEPEAARVEGIACAIDDSPASVPPPVPATARWHDGALIVTVAGAAPAAGRAVLSRGLVALELPATVGDGGLVVRIDPRTADLGGPLADGIWRLGVAVGDAPLTPVAAGTTPAAIVDGRPHAITRIAGAACLDVGATRRPVTGRIPAARAAAAESAHGALVTLDFPDLPMWGDTSLPARVLLGDLTVRGRVVGVDGHARVEAQVGALPGSLPLAVGIGGGAPAATGLLLRVDGTGSMRFEPPAVPPAPPSPAVQRFRRRVPAPLEPVARQLVRVPALRRAYRRLLTR